MTTPPARPKIYHITHVDNLTAIAKEGCLVSDATVIARGGPVQAIGMSAIKRRRVEELEVSCHPGTKVGDYVPFYFCPRSVMLYVIHCANHPELSYRGGQGSIVHLEADFHQAVAWANKRGMRWALSLSNSGARYTEFRSDVDRLHELDWDAIAARDFRDPDVKERKQAEFLLYDMFPFCLVERIGVLLDSVKMSVRRALDGTAYKPVVEVRPHWYF
jgi:hypothetical protein